MVSENNNNNNYSAVDNNASPSLDEFGSLLPPTTTTSPNNKHRQKPFVVVAASLAALCLVFFGVVSRGGNNSGSTAVGGRGVGSAAAALVSHYDDDYNKVILRDGECLSFSKCEGDNYLIGCDDYEVLFDDQGITGYNDAFQEKLFGERWYTFDVFLGRCIIGDKDLYCNDANGDRMVTVTCEKSGFDRGSCTLCQDSHPEWINY